jgi:hypothetical protein
MHELVRHNVPSHFLWSNKSLVHTQIISTYDHVSGLLLFRLQSQLGLISVSRDERILGNHPTYSRTFLDFNSTYSSLLTSPT